MSEEHGIDAEPGERFENRDGIDFDELFDLLSKDRRRYALYCFASGDDERYRVSGLVDRLAAIERETSDRESPRQEIELSLQHAHLPKLAAASIVEYDPDDAIVEFRGGDRVEKWATMAARAEFDGDVPRIG